MCWPNLLLCKHHADVLCLLIKAQFRENTRKAIFEWRSSRAGFDERRNLRRVCLSKNDASRAPSAVGCSIFRNERIISGGIRRLKQRELWSSPLDLFLLTPPLLTLLSPQLPSSLPFHYE